MNHTSIDTETINGYAVMLCTPEHTLYRPSNFEEIADWLISARRNEGIHIWTFNLRFDAFAIIKYLPIENLKELYENNRTTYNGYKLFLIPKKTFSISKQGHRVTLTDAMQFYNLSLDKASQIYLNESKITNPIVESFKAKQRLWSSDTLIKWIDAHYEIIEKYCKHDAYLTANLGRLIDEATQNIYGFSCEHYTSSATIGEKATWNYLNGEPYGRAFDFMRQLAEANFRGGIFETGMKGHFYEITDIDVNSMYPHFTVDLPNFKNGKFLEVNDEKQFEGQTYGWLLCRFDCPYIPYATGVPVTWTDILPNNQKVTYISDAETIIYPHGEREGILTIVEYNFLKTFGFKCELICGYVWFRDSDQYKNPFGWINDIADKKEILKKEGKKNTMEYTICKIGMNGTYGKTVQKIGRGRLKNPLYGSTITACSRVMLDGTLLSNGLQDKTINKATDGALLAGDYRDLIPSTEKMGEFTVQYYDEGIVLGNGMLALYGKNGVNSRMRGISEKQDIDLKTILQHYPEAKTLPFRKLRPVHLGECLLHYKVYSISDLNLFKPISRLLDVNSDKKRQWENWNFGELLNNTQSGKKWTIKEWTDKYGRNE